MEKHSNIRFYENPLSGRRVVPRGWTVMAKLIEAFSNFANAPANGILNINNATLVSSKQSTKGSPTPIHKRYISGTFTITISYKTPINYTLTTSSTATTIVIYVQAAFRRDKRK